MHVLRVAVFAIFCGLRRCAVARRAVYLFAACMCVCGHIILTSFVRIDGTWHQAKIKEQSRKAKKFASNMLRSKKGTASTATADSKEGNDKAVDNRPKFEAAEAFAGSKEGYCFRKGEQGLGYYIDVPPVVNPEDLKGGHHDFAHGHNKAGNFLMSTAVVAAFAALLVYYFAEPIIRAVFGDAMAQKWAGE